MTNESSHGAGSREPVIHGGRRVRGLHQRVLKDGRVVFEARLRIDGKDARVVLEATTKTDAVREYQGLRTDRDRGDIHENRLLNPTVADAVDEWMEHISSRVGIADENRRYSELTLDGYRGQLRKHVVPFLGSKRIADVTTSDLRRLVTHLQAKKLASNTASTIIGTTSSLFSFALKQGYVGHNPCRDLGRDDRPSGKRATEPRYLSPSEIELLLAHSPDIMRPILATFAYAALRQSEALGLHWRDVDFHTDTISVRGQLSRKGAIVPVKTDSSVADVPMVPALKRELLAHRSRQAERNLASVQPDRLVFTSKTGHHWTHRRVGEVLRAVCDRIGLNPQGVPPVGCHDLRHSCISIALASGATDVEAAELARHANPVITMAIYAGLTKDGHGRAVKKMLESGFGS